MAVISVIPSAIGVPGLDLQPPKWASTDPGPGAVNPNLDDPRWRGAYQVGFGSGTNDQLTFRALTNSAGTALYLSWYIKVDPSLSSNQDYVQLGLEKPGVVPLTFIRVQMNGTSDVNAADLASGAYVLEVKQSSGALPTLATAINNTLRVWRTGGANSQWAVQMVVPIGAGASALNLGASTQFLMWFYVNINPLPMAPVQYRWPNSGLTALTPYPFNLLSYPATGSGEPCSLVGAGGNTAKKAISIAWNQVGKRLTALAAVDEIDVNNPNTLFAEPSNDSGSTIPANTITADFRLANWGSAAALGAWSKVATTSVHAAAVSGGPPAKLEAPFTVSAADKAKYTATRHQCMLVELSGPGLTFTTSSVVRNMNFVGASTFRRTAEISVVGLAPISIQPRDVYLYVETVNFPTKETEHDTGKRNELINWDLKPEENFRNLQESWVSGKIPMETFEELMPTYRVHAYHDTGARVTVGGTVYPVLEPQGSFGYHLFHQGQLEGWAHNLSGAEKIAENIYLIRVPNNGVAQVETIIQAVEPGEQRLPPEPIVPRPTYTENDARQGCLSLLLALLKAISKLIKP